MIAKITAMKEMPKNCMECTELCRLPERIKTDLILAKYRTKRHEDCPLREVNDTEESK